MFCHVRLLHISMKDQVLIHRWFSIKFIEKSVFIFFESSQTNQKNLAVEKRTLIPHIDSPP